VRTASGFDVLCLMIRRRFVAALGGWPEHGGAIEPIGNLGDDETLLRVIVERGKHRIIDQVLAYHRTLRATSWRRHFVLSFPKAGRTWVRFLLGNYLRRHLALALSPAECLEIEKLTTGRPGWPQVEVTHDRRCDHVPVSQLERSVEAFRGEDVTLLVRDPRDVLISWFFEKTRRYEKVWRHASDGPGNLSEFVRSEYGIALVLRWMQDWGEQLDVPARVRFFRYEDFHADAATSARALLDWLGVAPVDEAALAEAVAASSFQAMHQLEASGGARSHRLRPGDASDPESFKVRRGVVGGYRDYLGPDDLAYIEERMARDLPACFGYLPCR
jgi:hypothetical protein